MDGSGNPLDTSGDGLPDYVKDANGDGVFDAGDVSDWLNPFTIYDQWVNYGVTPAHLRLGYWKFNTSALKSEAGQGPTTSTGWSLTNSWDGTALCMTNTDTSSQLIYGVDYGGQSVFTPGNGTLRWWFQPDWSTGPSAPSGGVTFFRAGLSIDGLWELSVVSAGTTNCGLLQFLTYSNDYQQQWSFSSGGRGALVNFQAGLWYQMALTYSPTNIAFYTNGVLLATASVPPVLSTTGGPIFEDGLGVSYYPDATYLTGGFCFGNIIGHASAVRGQLDELETFNYPLTAQAIAAGFPSFGGVTGNTNDADYDGRSDMLETNVDGTNPTDSNSVAQCRLGYWRFDTPWLYSEQGQMPKSQSGVTLSNSWSGTAANISGSGGQLTYRDICTNGWANFNCQQGCLRFWFKPNWNSGSGPSTAPFVYLGNPTPGNGEWSLQIASSGNAIQFVTASGGATTFNIPATSCSFSSNHWSQIVLNYGPGGSVLFINGAVFASNNTAVVLLPSPADRARGMVIGNSTAGTACINGQFEELETFNYPLSAGDIAANFQAVQFVDSDLNGIPDLLEDIQLGTNRPFLGAPLVITGTVEAEQFDLGGSNIAYCNVSSNPTNNYRPTGMYISTNGMSFGYCLDQMRAGDWANYTINVLVAGNYTVETRAEAIGTNVGGMFQCDFTNSGSGFTNTTGALSITATGWTNVPAVLYLTNGVNVMKLHCLSNGTGSTNVGRFDYISIYPWWPDPLQTNVAPNVSGLISDDPSWHASTNNAFQIQQVITGFPNGGVISIPGGTYYVAQVNPDDTQGAIVNSAMSVLANHVIIEGTGVSNTTLVAHNRATTIFEFGYDAALDNPLCTNLTLRDMTLVASPHLVYTNQSTVNSNIYERGQLYDNGLGSATGNMVVFYPKFGLTNQPCQNILITNCAFVYGVESIGLYAAVSNCLIRNCTFIPWDTNSTFDGTTNEGPTNTAYTTGWHGADVGIFGGGNNIRIVDNVYTNLGTVPNTHNFQAEVAPDGFVWMQGGGNIFIARNLIGNWALEGIQLVSGPNAVVGNIYNTVVSDGSACALAFGSTTAAGLTGTSNDYSTCFVGNWVLGGRTGAEPGAPQPPTVPGSTLSFSGNYLNLFPPFDETGDNPTAAVEVSRCQSVSVCGNTMVAGGRGFMFFDNCTNALVLMNDFSGATYSGIGYGDSESSITNVQFYRNTLGEGATYHLQLPPGQGSGWFLQQNQYLNGTNRVPLFTDPISTPVHASN